MEIFSYSIREISVFRNKCEQYRSKNINNNHKTNPYLYRTANYIRHTTSIFSDFAFLRYQTSVLTYKGSMLTVPHTTTISLVRRTNVNLKKKLTLSIERVCNISVDFCEFNFGNFSFNFHWVGIKRKISICYGKF